MSNHEQPYDPYIPAGGTGGQQGQGQNGNHRTAALQAVCVPVFFRIFCSVCRCSLYRIAERSPLCIRWG